MSQSRMRCGLVATLTLFFGLHIFRVYLPTLFWFLGQSLSAEGLALYALGTFALTLFAPLVRRWLSEPAALVVSVGGVALVRLAIQVVRAPLANLVLTTLGVGFLGWFLPMWCQSRRNCPSRRDVPMLAVAFPLAFLLDTGSRSLLLSYDLAWREGWGPTLVVVGLVVMAFVLLTSELRECAIGSVADQPAEEPSLSWVIPLLGLGPWLYLAMAITHNPSALVAATGWDYGPASVAVSGFAALGAVASVWVAGWSALQRWYWAVFGGILLVGSLAFLVAGVGPGWLWVGLASLSSWAALGEVLTSTARTGPLQPGLWRSGLITFLALVTMLVMVIEVVGYNLLWFTPVGGAILALAALWATRAEAGRDTALLRSRGVSVGAVATGIVLAVGLWATLNRAPKTIELPAPGEPLRVMTYNIHHGVDADHRMDLEEIADVIAHEAPDVIVLNEVNRARVNNGFVDTLPLIARRLRMQYVYGANHPDGQYGNALLSQYPILSWDNIHYQHNTTEIRGVLRVVIQTASGPITFYGTHLDHIRDPKDVRDEQVMEALAAWGGEPRAILLGDLNAEPDAPELQSIYEAGFLDALAASGQDDVYTSWDPTANRRIDYIFQTPDLTLQRAWVVRSRASDHLPVLADVIP